MNFKLNPFERFVIRNRKVLRWCLYIAALTLILVCVPIATAKGISFAFVIPAVFLLLVPVLYVDMLAPLKFLKIEKIADRELDLSAAIVSADAMLGILKDNQLDYIGEATLIKASALYDMGEKDSAKSYLNGFLDKCDVKNPPYAQIAECHTVLAIMALCEYDFREFEFQKSRIVRNTNDSRPEERIALKHFDYVGQLDFNAKLYTAQDYDAELEKEALDRIAVRNGKKIPERKRTPLSYISVYSMLFDYFKRLNIEEKTHYYARKLQRIANDQFECYREAKEYLDNENIID